MRTFSTVLRLAVCSVALLGLDARGAEPAVARKISFSRQIRPILSDKCFKCHGPDDKNRESGLRLDLKDGAFAAVESGKLPIVAGQPAKSELFLRISHTDADVRMPPADSNKQLTAAEIELIKQWIAQGAGWEEHWAFTPPVRPQPPQVKQAAWPKTPIDHFIAARLEEEGLAPSPEAERLTLLRRVSLDLTGLPPTPEEAAAFLADKSPEAYEKVVDRLLRSPRYGEHMARFWLDAARYGDTHGLHLDNYREMWPYRDWVVQAFNKNMPYDQFTVEQLAGDLLPDASTDQLVATGFNRCHVTTNEGGSIAEEVYVRNVVDRVVTTGTVFMGMTFECTRCHDHKYDPFTMTDFYSLFAFFNSLDGKPLDGNKAQHAPVLNIVTPEAAAELKRIEGRIAELKSQISGRRVEVAASEAYAQWLEQATKDRKQPRPLPTGEIAHLPLDESNGDTTSAVGDDLAPGNVVGAANWKPGKHGGAFDFNGKTRIDLGDVGNFERDHSFSYGAWVKPRKNRGGVVLARMNDGNGHRGYDLYVTGGKVAVHIIHRWPNNAIKVTTKKALAENQWQHVFATYDGSSKAAGVKIYFDGKEQPWDVNVDNLKDTIRTKVDLRLGARSPGSVFNGQVDDVRIYDRTLSADEVTVLAGSDPIAPILAVAPAERTKQQVTRLVDHYLRNFDKPAQQLDQQLAALQSEATAASNNKATTLIWKERATPKQAFMLKRGEYDQRGDPVTRRTPTTLPPMKPDLPVNRLGLARWLVDPGHPLTARVAVNRFWLQVFGTGLVKTAEDFGSQGEPPSHPELLDWLAVDFVESGWDVKRLMKQLVMSAAYRQSSEVTPMMIERDPRNRLLARGPRFRLDAEMLRDQALYAGGLLVEKQGGPSVKPPQPDGLWFAVGYSGSNTVRFKADEGPEKVHRRTLYTFIKRTAPPPQMSTFDAPSREACTMRRERTNTPLQALLLLNDPQYFEAAQALARRTMRAASEPTERAAYLFRLCACREATDAEMKDLIADYQDHLKYYQQQADAAKKVIGPAADAKLDAAEAAAWTMVANLVLNLDEVITKN